MILDAETSLTFLTVRPLGTLPSSSSLDLTFHSQSATLEAKP